MPNDARISTGLPHHPKTKKLTRRLGEASGWYLLRLILWAATNRSNGDFSGLSDEDLEIATDWPGEANAFIATLSDVGFLDGAEYSRKFHDWEQHNPWVAGAGKRSEKARFAALCKQHGKNEAAAMMPDYAAKLAVKAETAEAKGRVGSANGTGNAAQSSVPTACCSVLALPNVDSGLAVATTRSAPSPSPTPSPTPTLYTPLPPQGVPRAAILSAATSDVDELFEQQFWPAYPLKSGKADALKAFRALKVTPELLIEILAGLVKWKSHPRWTKDAGAYIKTPGPWLRQRLWEDEAVCGKPSAPAEVPDWVILAGFECEAEAHNRMCWQHNAHLFRDGNRVEAKEAAA